METLRSSAVDVERSSPNGSPLMSRSGSQVSLHSASTLGMSGLTAMAQTLGGFKPAALMMADEPLSNSATTPTAYERAQLLLNGSSFSSMGSVTSQGWAVGDEGGSIRTGRASSFRVAPQINEPGDERPWTTQDI